MAMGWSILQWMKRGRLLVGNAAWGRSLFQADGRDLREEVDHDVDDGGLERDHEVSSFVL